MVSFVPRARNGASSFKGMGFILCPEQAGGQESSYSSGVWALGHVWCPPLIFGQGPSVGGARQCPGRGPRRPRRQRPGAHHPGPGAHHPCPNGPHLQLRPTPDSLPWPRLGTTSRPATGAAHAGHALGHAWVIALPPGSCLMAPGSWLQGNSMPCMSPWCVSWPVA